MQFVRGLQRVSARPRPASRLILGLLVSVLALSVFGSVPTVWRLEGQADFLSGEAQSLTIDSEGVITLAPTVTEIYEGSEPFFWEVAADAAGNFFLGSGNEGKIYKASGGETEVFADTNELQIHALATDSRNNLYAGSSPQGRVYRFTPDGTQEVFFDPEDRYIWAIAVDRQSAVYVATGDKAQIYRVSSSGQSEVIFTSEETHIVSLIVDNEGTVYAGSEPHGLVYQIDRDGNVGVLYDTPFQEVRALVKDSRGNVFAAALNGGANPSSPSPTPVATTAPALGQTSTSSPSGDSVTVTASVTAVGPTPGSTPSTGSSGDKGALFRIEPDGSAHRLWSSTREMPMSLTLERDDRVLVGTGDEGRLFLVSQDKTSSLLLSLEEDQITGIVRTGNDTHLVTSNPARLYRVGQRRSTEGSFQSAAKDTTTLSSWGKIRWDARIPDGTSLTVQTRVGNSETPDQTWSEWSVPYTLSDGEQIASPRGRFLQWRAVLTSDGGASPELSDVTAVYLPQNLAPEIGAIVIHDPGQTFQRPLTTQGPLDILGMQELLSDQRPSDSAATAALTAMTSFSRPYYRRGYQTVSWSATDPNRDELRYQVLYRADGESLWRTMRGEQDEAVVAWDTVSMPDGRYQLRIIANDGIDNPSALALSGEKISRSLKVDNSAPRVDSLSATAAGDGFRIVFEATDSASPIQKAAYAINSGEWRIIYPDDGIPDSEHETFDFAISGFRDGVYTLVVKVEDSLGNAATAQVELR